MRKQRLALAVVVTVLLTGMSAVCATPAAQAANHCGRYTFPGPVPPEQGQTSVVMGGGYWHVGGPGPLDNAGCFNGGELYDTRLLQPRADYVIVVVSHPCSAGQTLNEGSSLVGLGANYHGLSFRCGNPDAFGRTAFTSSVYPIQPNRTGTITATVVIGGVAYSTTSRTMLTQDQPV